MCTAVSVPSPFGPKHQQPKIPCRKAHAPVTDVDLGHFTTQRQTATCVAVAGRTLYLVEDSHSRWDL